MDARYKQEPSSKLYDPGEEPDTDLDIDINYTKMRAYQKRYPKVYPTKTIMIGLLVTGLVGGLFGVILGYFSHTYHENCVTNYSVTLHSVLPENGSITDRILREVNPQTIKTSIGYFSRSSHVAGSEADKSQAEEIDEMWRSFGFDLIETVSYPFMFSFPNPEKPSVVSILSSGGQPIYQHDLLSNANGSVHPYIAYSASGIAEGLPVYVNYGSEEDLAFVVNTYGFELMDKIIIVRIGEEEFGNIISRAENKYDVGAVVFYPDPRDFDPSDDENGTFRSFPRDAVIGGTAVNQKYGDLLTPGYPSKDFTFKLSRDSTHTTTHIPVVSVSQAVAYKILSLMGGEPVVDKWGAAAGKFNISYRVGPGFTSSSWTLSIDVQMVEEERQTYNVIGYIKGKVETDRYVIIGNHRDSISHGAVDGTSGGAVLNEVARTFGKLLSEGWRPKRTLVFCSWGASEPGLIGVTEWVEEYKRMLIERTVAYINVDKAVTGNSNLAVTGSPLLHEAIFNVSKAIPSPDLNDRESNLSLYDSWLLSNPTKQHSLEYFADNDRLGAMEIYQRSHRPRVEPPYGDDDYKPFIRRLGIPILDLTYAGNEKVFRWAHTQYDTAELINKHIDPDYRYHVAITQLVAELMRDLSDSLILPFNVVDYAEYLQKLKHTIDVYLEADARLESYLQEKGFNLAPLEDAIQNFTIGANQFIERTKRLDMRNPLLIRRANDQMMLLERCFLDPNGISGREFENHLLFTPGEKPSYVDETFPGLNNIFRININDDYSADTDEILKQLKYHLSVLINVIQGASYTLADFVQ